MISTSTAESLLGWRQALAAALVHQRHLGAPAADVNADVHPHQRLVPLSSSSSGSVWCPAEVGWRLTYRAPGLSGSSWSAKDDIGADTG